MGSLRAAPDVRGLGCFITGGSMGIGAALGEALVRRGAFVTLVDRDERGREVARALDARGGPGKCQFVWADVRDHQQNVDAARAHMDAFGRMDIAVLNAGIGEYGDFASASTNADQWREVVDADLSGVVSGTWVAIQHLKAAPDGSPRLLANVASAGGILPMPHAPVYAATKGGVVHFTRSLAGLKRRYGIRCVSLCPSYIDTHLVQQAFKVIPPRAKRAMLDVVGGELMGCDVMVDALDRALADQALNGVALYISRDEGGREATSAVLPDEYHRLLPNGWIRRTVSTKGPPGKRLAPGRLYHELTAQLGRTSVFAPGAQHRGLLAQRAAWARMQVASAACRGVIVHALNHDFRAATRVETLPAAAKPSGPGQGHVLLVRVFAGVNASDVNYSSGRYHNSRKEAAAALPYPSGFEASAVVAEVGPGVKGIEPGTSVVTMTYGGFSTQVVEAARSCIPVADPGPEAVALATSGLTASIALDQVAELQPGETVLVTAAAGGTGQFACQIAKLMGCRVFATCSSPAKSDLLKSFGVDRVVNYKEENLDKVLAEECPTGLDVVYESVGGSMLDVALKHLAVRGRLVVIGMMSQYGEGWPASQHRAVPERLLAKSASIRGFFLPAFGPLIKPHMAMLAGLLRAGKLRVEVDPTPFAGVERVADAVEHLQSGCSRGKVVVQMCKQLPPGTGAQARM
ncbi:unnamed protein product [Pedinophyceae sp. YPF-701]|nr:unnamed protein product [Pedinophyceae sp. YPF-701]